MFTPDASLEHEGKFERRNLWEAEKVESKVEEKVLKEKAQREKLDRR